MDAQHPVAVVIPHHSRRDLLDLALDSVRGYSVFLVDDSPMGIAPADRPPATAHLRTAGAEGFARAANRGLAAAQRDGFTWVLLLNDDACPRPGCVDALLEAVQADPAVAAAGPVLLDANGAVESAGIRVHHRTARVRQCLRVPPDLHDVDAASGACLLVASRERFDERYYFGFEDIELCHRIRARGGRVVLVPQARCDHQGGATMPRRGRQATRHALAGHLRLVEERPWQRPLVLLMALAQVLREGGPPARLTGLWEGWRDARRG